MALDDLQLTAKPPPSAAHWQSLWQPGETGAASALRQFLDHSLAGYQQGRELPGQAGTSRLSPHLHFGELSPRQLWREIKTHSPDDASLAVHRDRFLAQLGWREFSHHLLQPWQAGERWFWDTLVDADLANSAASWQWVAGSGADAAPYFRIFNPALQGQRFDPEGRYVRRWVPELAALPNRHLHTPAKAPEAVLKAAGLRMGATYPEPIVEHRQARSRALEAYRSMRDDARLAD